MPSRRAYDLMYRFWAPWSMADRWEIRQLVESGRAAPTRLAPGDGATARAIDLGCGEGGVSIWLAEHGFRTVGVDFSPVALRKARQEAERRGIGEDQLALVEGDLTAPAIPGVAGPFDLLVDYGTLDDFGPPDRPGVAALITRLSRPGSLFFLYAFYGALHELPRISFSGPSRASPGLVPGEVEALFGVDWDIEPGPRHEHRFIETFVLTRR